MTLNLKRLEAQKSYFDANGRPTMQMQIFWQQTVEALESATNALIASDANQDALLAQILAAQATADAAQGTADAAAKEAARTSSYTAPTSVLTAADVGSDATITIAAHTRVYPGAIDDVALAGGTITGLPFSTAYYVYYDDATLADTTPSFLATTSVATAQVGAAAGRHFVGYVMTPADGGASSGGTGGSPPGGGGGNPIP